MVLKTSGEVASSGLPAPPNQEMDPDPGYTRRWWLRMAAHVAIMATLSSLLVKYGPLVGLWTSNTAQDLFSVVIDAGSTGSRVFVFHFKARSGGMNEKKLTKVSVKRVFPSIKMYDYFHLSRAKKLS